MADDSRLAPALYRAAARALFAPFGGLDAVRRRALDALDVGPGARVLELGCGPGALTAALVARRAHVHAVDRSPTMLRAAAHRAPSAQFERADVRRFVPAATYDAVLLAFVLHELPAPDVRAAVGRAAGALAPGGRLVVLDHAAPSGLAGRAWRVVLRTVESPAIEAWLDLDLVAVLRGAGLLPGRDQELAGGRVRLLVS